MSILFLKREFLMIIQFNNDTVNDNTVQTIEVHNHLGLSLDKKIDFNIHIENKINKCKKMIDIMKRLSLSISRDSLLTI